MTVSAITKQFGYSAYPEVYAESLLEEVARRCFEQHRTEVRLFPLALQQEWSQFVECYQRKNGLNLISYSPVIKVAWQYLSGKEARILDIGCETGKNAICIADAGHKVTLVDISPRAVEYTLKNMGTLKLTDRVEDYVIAPIEKLEPRYNQFTAVVGTYTFSFIPPEKFEEVMVENVLGRIKAGGYFAGGFFGPKHAWAKSLEKTFLTEGEIQDFFSKHGFTILHLQELKEQVPTAFNGKVLFHTFEVIAQKRFVSV